MAKSLNQFIKISIATQTLSFYSNAKLESQYAISSAAKGTGQQYGSEQTPLGKHIVRAKIGGGLPLNAVLKGRRFTGEIYDVVLADQYPQRDWILTRILWLSGTEPGNNRLHSVDTMRRYIYIHGTPDTEPMGLAASHGCIRMRNTDIMELFNNVLPGCPVDIVMD